MKKIYLILAIAAAVLSACCNCYKGIDADGKWTAEKANAWYEETGWRSGCNYIPANAINQIEMWSSDTFDPQTIDTELGWAEELGFNTMRVFLSSVVWQNEPDAFKRHVSEFLDIAAGHGITPFLVFFDDCHVGTAAYGTQPEPKTGVHNSGWVKDPANDLFQDTLNTYPFLEAYVKDILTTFKDDSRILWWDLYNEPNERGIEGNYSLALLKNVFRWAREIRPSQPLSVGVWTDKPYLVEHSKYSLEMSDIISYHEYHTPEMQMKMIDSLKTYGRPMYCTEYMARTKGSTFQTILPLLKENNVSAINWGFVKGKTNTIYAWGDVHPEGEEPEPWFHDIIRPDKTPFSQEEIDVIKAVNGKE